MEVLRYGEESVLLSFEEIKPHDWKEKVYQPDIQDNWEKLYRKPGYEMQLTARRSRSDGLKNGSARRSIGKPKREPIADQSSAIRFTFLIGCFERSLAGGDRLQRRIELDEGCIDGAVFRVTAVTIFGQRDHLSR